jgi:hypothetical protein
MTNSNHAYPGPDDSPRKISKKFVRGIPQGPV